MMSEDCKVLYNQTLNVNADADSYIVHSDYQQAKWVKYLAKSDWDAGRMPAFWAIATLLLTYVLSVLQVVEEDLKLGRRQSESQVKLDLMNRVQIYTRNWNWKHWANSWRTK